MSSRYVLRLDRPVRCANFYATFIDSHLTLASFFFFVGLYDSIFLTFFVLYQLALLLIPARVIVTFNLPPVSSFTVLAEQVIHILSTVKFFYNNQTVIVYEKAICGNYLHASIC